MPILTVFRRVSPWTLCGLLFLGASPALAQDREDESEAEEDESEEEDSDKKDSEDEGSEENSEEDSDEKSDKGSKSLPDLIPEPEDSDAPPLPEPEQGDVKGCQLHNGAPLSPILGLSTLILLAPLRSKPR